MITFGIGLALFFAPVDCTGNRQVDSSPRTVINRLIECLNSKDEDDLTTFVAKWTPSQSDATRRKQAWGGLRQDIGPFKLVSDGPETDSEVDAIATDRYGSRIVLMLRFVKMPALRITGLLVRPAYAVEGPPHEFSNWRTLDELAHQIARATDSPGMGIAVVRGGRLSVAVSGSRQAAANDPIRPDDVWSIGSIGKSLCSSVIGALIERGKLRWDETLAEALPGVPMLPAYQAVTLEQIMHHRGGIPADLAFTQDRVNEPAAGAKTPTELRAKYARDILARNPIAPPGERFTYSNAGYALLSVAAETGPASHTSPSSTSWCSSRWVCTTALRMQTRCPYAVQVDTCPSQVALSRTI